MAVLRTHNLLELLLLLLPHDATLNSLKRGSESLSHFAVEYRYPGTNATTRQTQSALRYMERVRKQVRTKLGLSG